MVAWLKSAFTAGWLTFADWQAPGGALRHACKMVLEGIVSKRLGSRYRSGRSPDWLKFKNPQAPRIKREAEEDWDHEAGTCAVPNLQRGVPRSYCDRKISHCKLRVS